MIEKRLHLAVALADEGDDAYLRGVLPGHGAEQGAFPDAAAAEDSDSLSLSAREQAVNRANSRDQALRDMAPLQRIRRRCIQWIGARRIDGRPAIHGLSKSIQNSSY